MLDRRPSGVAPAAITLLGWATLCLAAACGSTEPPGSVDSQDDRRGDAAGFEADGTAYEGHARSAGIRDAGPFAKPDGAPGPPPGTLPIGASESFLGQKGAVQIGYDGCNSVSFAQIPGHIADFVGRHLVNTDPLNGCSGTHFSLSLYRMDWANNHLRYVHPMFAVPQPIPGGATVDSAYDGSVAELNGTIWVAFECVGVNITGVATCVGPYDAATGTVDPMRTSVPVFGAAADGSDDYSASVPKLLAFGGKLYLYWTAVRMSKLDGHWIALTTRGARMVESGGKLWAAGAGGASVPSLDPAHNIEVWGNVSTDPQATAVADTGGVYTDGKHIFATTILSAPCGLHGVYPVGCKYRSAIARTINPLSPQTFRAGAQLDAKYLPSNAQGYARFYQRPDGSTHVMGFYPASPPGAPNPLPLTGLIGFPVPSDAAFFDPGP